MTSFQYFVNAFMVRGWPVGRLRSDIYQDAVSGYAVTLTDTDAGRTVMTSVKFPFGQLAAAVAYAKRLVD